MYQDIYKISLHVNEKLLWMLNIIDEPADSDETSCHLTSINKISNCRPDVKVYFTFILKSFIFLQFLQSSYCHHQLDGGHV